VNSINNNNLLAGIANYPLIQSHEAGDTIAWHNGVAISRQAFLKDVYTAASRLPEGQYAINLCEDRYWFLVGFSALLIRKQTNLLPPNRAIQVINEIAHDYSGAFCLCDTYEPDLDIPVHKVSVKRAGNTEEKYPVPMIPGRHLAAIAFTSGSTGKASPNQKFWKGLILGARMKQKRFKFGKTSGVQTIFVTVPPQHMYGLETSIMNPLINGVSVYTNKLFFPADINSALNNVPEPRVLITTPIHMKSCVETDLKWPRIDFVISATAPLDKSLASRAEELFNCPIMEIYGCTEANSMASRRTVTDKHWLLYDDISLKQKTENCYVSGPNLPEDVPLQDVIEIVNNREFILHGRNSDMINIGGKRASLEDLNCRLRSIDGILDAAFIIPDSNDNMHTKLAALVVSPTLDADEIRYKLALKIDAVFLPRPLYIVDKLPRSETGKLPRSALLELLDKMRNTD
jgi:acyl-coenzyme A synthetase/AMP-(fatty) acid ligase